MFSVWDQKSLDQLTMCLLWQAAPYASKKWLTSWQGRETILLLTGEQCGHSQHWEWLGALSATSTCSSWQHGTKITPHKGRCYMVSTLILLYAVKEADCACCKANGFEPKQILLKDLQNMSFAFSCWCYYVHGSSGPNMGQRKVNMSRNCLIYLLLMCHLVLHLFTAIDILWRSTVILNNFIPLSWILLFFSPADGFAVFLFVSADFILQTVYQFPARTSAYNSSWRIWAKRRNSFWLENKLGSWPITSDCLGGSRRTVTRSRLLISQLACLICWRNEFHWEIFWLLPTSPWLGFDWKLCIIPLLYSPKLLFLIRTSQTCWTWYLSEQIWQQHGPLASYFTVCDVMVESTDGIMPGPWR